MIEENIPIIKKRTRNLYSTLMRVYRFLDDFTKADEFATLTSEQKATKIGDFQELKKAYETAKSSFEEAVTTTEPIVEEEE